MHPLRVLSFRHAWLVVWSLVLLTSVKGVDQPEVHLAPPVTAALGTPLALQPLPQTTGATYEWRLNGRVLAGKTQATLTLPAAKAGDAGIYRVRAGQGAITEIRVAVYDSVGQAVPFFPGRPVVLSMRAWGPGIAWRWPSFPESWQAHGATTPRLTLDGSLTLDLSEGTVEGYLIFENTEVLVASYDLVRAVDSLPPVIQPGPVSRLRLGQPFTSPVLVESESEFTMTVTGLPPGLVCDTGTAVISGTPTKVGEYTVRIQARNKAGAFGPVIWQVGVMEQAGTDYGPGGRFFGAFSVDHLHKGSRHQTTPDLIMVDMTRAGLVSGYMQIGPKKVAFAGAMVRWEFPPLVISRYRTFTIQGYPNVVDMTLTLDQRINQGVVTFTATLKGSSYELWEHTVELHREIQPTQREIQYLGGRYNVLLSSLTPDSGSGFGSLTFAGGRTARMVGTLPDGSGFTTSSPLLRDSETQMPRFDVRYSSVKDSRLHGFVEVLGPAIVSGSMQWSLPFNESSRLFLGFFPGASFQVIGGRYFAPPAGVLAVPYALAREGNMLLTLGSYGALTAGGGAEILQSFTLTAGHRALFPPDSPYQMKLDLYAPSGFFTGSFVLEDPDPLDESRTIQRKVTFRGMTVPGLNMAEGYFLLPQLPDPLADPPTTLNTSPIYSGKMTLVPEG